MMLMLVGIYCWSFFEYVISRYGIATENLPNIKIFLLVHFFLGGIHRAFPTEKYRTVCPVFVGNFIFYIIIKPLFSNVCPEVW
jgi:hypothetical protein